MTAEEIYYGISSGSIAREMGIKLIENYGIQQKKEFINKFHADYPVWTEDIKAIIDSINEKLDTMLKNIVEAARE